MIPLALLLGGALALSVTGESMPKRKALSKLQAGPRGAVKRLAMASGRDQEKATFAAFRSREVVKLAREYPPMQIARERRPPMSLTASDGTGLRLISLRAKAVLMGPLAFTELHLTFRNPESRVREGRFEITLPPGAAISRFAMKLPHGWQEAEIVERHRARQIYEDFLHRKQDPALLEKKAGNQFRARVFPIPAGGVKEIKLSFSQNLPRTKQPYRLHLKGLPKMNRLEVMAMVDRPKATKGPDGYQVLSRQVVQLKKHNYKPTRDFVIKAQAGVKGLRSGELAVVRVAPKVSASRAPMKSLRILVDTSASRAAGYLRQVRQVAALIKRLRETYDNSVQLKVACFDQGVLEIFSGRIDRFSTEHVNRLLARRPLGASNLQQALKWARDAGGADRLLLVTDGIVTAGETDVAKLKAAVKALGPKTRRVDVMLVGGIRDEAAMRQLVQGTLSQDGVLLDGQSKPLAMANKLAATTVSGIKVTVPGAKWTWPERLDGVQPGDARLVFVQFPKARVAGSRARSLTVKLGGKVTQRVGATVASVKRPLLERAWVEARIAYLTRLRNSGKVNPDLRAVMVKQIVNLSKKFRVLSDYTAMLVLETAADYRRYNIDRRSLSGILVVGATGVEVKGRGRPVMRLATRPPVRRWRGRTDKDGEARAPTTGAAPKRAAKRRRQFDFQSDEVTGSLRRPEGSFLRARRRVAMGGGRSGSPASPAPEEASPGSAPLAKKVAPPRALRGPRGCGCNTGLGQVNRMAVAPVALVNGRPAVLRGPQALSGKLHAVMQLIRNRQVKRALLTALAWRKKAPGDVMALVALGEALEAAGNPILAARVYGSIIDLFPSRADMRRFAAARLETLGKEGLALAADCYKKAVKQRPDHASSHRGLAFALLRQGRYEAALSAIEAGIKQRYRIGRSGVPQILREDMGLIAAAYLARFPKQRSAVMQRLADRGASLATGSSLRFVLSWETDANDVDFHVMDGRGGHAYYSKRSLPSGGSLYADVRNGYGPECFTIQGRPMAYPYHLLIHYYSKGPMGYGMGKVQIIKHNGRGQLRFQDRPYVVMNNKAYVYLGALTGPL